MPARPLTVDQLPAVPPDIWPAAPPAPPPPPPAQSPAPGTQPSLSAVSNPDAAYEILSPTPLAPPNESYCGELNPPVLDIDAKLLVPPWVPTVKTPGVPLQPLLATAFVPPIPTTTVTLVAAVTAVAEVCVTPPPPPPRL